MEISGKFGVSSEQDSNLYCLPCDRDGLKVSAFGYCKDCEEHLCENCYKHHRKPKPSMNHVLLDKDRMPQQSKAGKINSDQITDFCTKHSDKPLEFYCNTHDSNACYVCVTLEHRHCKIDYIPDVSGSVSDELENLVDQIETLFKKCKCNVKIAKTEIVQADKIYKKIAEDLRVFRNEINEGLDQIEAKIMKEAQNYASRERCRQENVKAENLKIAEYLSSTRSMLKSLNDEHKQNKLFIEMKNIGPQVKRLSDKEKQLVENNKTESDVTFIRNENMRNYLKNENCLGKILTYLRQPCAESAVYFEYERTIQVKESSSDDEYCNYRNIIFISTTHAIVTDFDNCKIKMIDVDTGTLVLEKTVPSAALDIIKLQQNQLAVALQSNEFIQIMSYTDTSLSLDRRINIGESCYSVAHYQGKLVVGCFSGKLIILNLDGNVTQVFDKPEMFDRLQKIVVSNDEKFMYCCFSGHDKCIKLDWQGNVVQRFLNDDYRWPRGMQELEDGTLLVCCIDSENIVRLSNSLKICEIEGLETADLHRPESVTYNARDNKLYICCSSKEGLYPPCDIIKIFSIKWIPIDNDT